MTHYRETLGTLAAYQALEEAEAAYHDDLRAIMSGAKPFVGDTTYAERLMAAHNAFIASWETLP